MTTPAKKPNGSKARLVQSCPHVNECVAPRMHGELMVSIDSVAASVGILLEDAAGKGEHLNALTQQMSNALARLSDIGARLTVAEQREEQHLIEVGELRREIGRLRLPGGVNA